MAACPICKKAVAPRSQNGAFPFCSDRCRTIDLGNWLDEKYRVPVEEEDDKLSEGEPDPTSKGDVRN
jgi:endogenous inhibitor of DNA gyrase (YacG/DUF329 family)